MIAIRNRFPRGVTIWVTVTVVTPTFSDTLIPGYSQSKGEGVDDSIESHLRKSRGYVPVSNSKQYGHSYKIKFIYSEKATKFLRNLHLFLTGTKGQLISKWFFGVVNFLQKMNENMLT